MLRVGDLGLRAQGVELLWVFWGLCSAGIGGSGSGFCGLRAGVGEFRV